MNIHPPPPPINVLATALVALKIFRYELWYIFRTNQDILKAWLKTFRILLLGLFATEPTKQRSNNNPLAIVFEYI